MKYFVANWKTYKSLSEAETWIDSFIGKIRADQQLLDRLNRDEVKIIVCPPFPLLYPLKKKITEKNLLLGAQNISHFDEGPYTGEVSGKNLQGIADYVIVGHSERRRYFGESDEILTKKINLSLKYGLQPIFCLDNANQPIPNEVKIIAYEPTKAIGTGDNEPVENVLSFKKSLDFKSTAIFLYGGSVNENNARDYLSQPEINGFLISTASLDALSFYNIVSLV